MTRAAGMWGTTARSVAEGTLPMCTMVSYQQGVACGQDGRHDRGNDVSVFRHVARHLTHRSGRFPAPTKLVE